MQTMVVHPEDLQNISKVINDAYFSFQQALSTQGCSVSSIERSGERNYILTASWSKPEDFQYSMRIRPLVLGADDGMSAIHDAASVTSNFVTLATAARQRHLASRQEQSSISKDEGPLRSVCTICDCVYVPEADYLADFKEDAKTTGSAARLYNCPNCGVIEEVVFLRTHIVDPDIYMLERHPAHEIENSSYFQKLNARIVLKKKGK